MTNVIDDADLIVRLRHPLWVHANDGEPYLEDDATIKDMADAASEIERLRALLRRCMPGANVVDIGGESICLYLKEEMTDE